MLCSVIGLALDITRHSAMCPIPLIELSYLSVFDLSRQRPDSWNDPGSPAYISKVGSMAEETLILHLKHF